MLRSVARRLRGRTPAELYERTAQATTALLERLSSQRSGRPIEPGMLQRCLVAGVDPRAEELLRSHRQRTARAFFPGFADPHGTVRAMRAAQPTDEAEVLARVERIHRGEFDLLGHRGLDFGNPIDWHLDPIAGRRAPRWHWSRIPYLDERVVGDHKVVWELNRHQYFVTLGQAYWYTGDERHATLFARHVESWIEANPPKVGINWASSLEVAFRAMSWLWALHFFAHSPALTPALHERMLGMLHVHGRHLERYLSTYFSPNTHLTGEALGLVHIGLLVPELRGARRWRDLGIRVLEAEVQRQVRADGVYFEQATQYHRYTTEFYLHLLLLAERHEVRLSGSVRHAVQQLLEHLLHLTRGDGTMPLFGDDDGGRLVQLDGRQPRDVRGVLALGAAVFGRADWRFGARGDHALAGWMLGEAGLAALAALPASPPDARSFAFPSGGYFVMRGGWGERDPHLLIDCGPHGAMNCGHAHADALSFELWANGRALVVDPGTFSYSGEARDAFRSGPAHNAITVDGRGSSESGATAFSWRTASGGTVAHWATTECCDHLAGRVDGWARHPASIVHCRDVLFVRNRYLVLHDRLVAESEHEVALHFQLGLGLCARRERDAAALIAAVAEPAPLLRVEVFGAGAMEIEEGWVSPTYGTRERAPRLAFREPHGGQREREVGTVTFLLLPGPGGELPVVTECACESGRAFRVTGEGTDDVVLMRDARAAPQTAACGIETDARLAWVRRTGGKVSLVAVDASRLQVDARMLVGPVAAAGFHQRGC